MTTSEFTSRQVVKITGVTYRQLAYWRKTGLVVPARHTKGGHARYTFTDLVALRAARQLLDAGISLKKVRECLVSLNTFFPTLTMPLAELSLVATGDVILAFHAGAAFDAFTGQEWIIPVASLQRDVERLQGGPRSMVQGELFPDLNDEIKVTSDG